MLIERVYCLEFRFNLKHQEYKSLKHDIHLFVNLFCCCVFLEMKLIQ